VSVMINRTCNNFTNIPRDMSGSTLCFRCEHRALFLESGYRPRFECGEVNHSNYVCYMYRPVIPCILKKHDGDKRPQFAGYMLSARSISAGLPNVEHRYKKLNSGVCVYVVPKKSKEE